MSRHANACLARVRLHFGVFGDGSLLALWTLHPCTLPPCV